MPETLKPCPFCGRSSTGVFPTTNNPDYHFSVFCAGCDTSGPERETKKEAVEAWNRRASGWISVKDRLPDFGMRVLAGSFGDVSEAFFDGSVFVITDGQLLPNIKEDLQDAISHWMPLPSAPEDKE